MTREEKNFLLKWVRTVILGHFSGENPEPEAHPEPPTGVFVTLHKFSNLRGCIGYIQADDRPLVETVRDAALAAAFHDPRFPPLSEDEFEDVDIEISLLSSFVEVKDVSEIEVGRDGLYLKKGFRSGLLLPQVPVEQEWDLDNYLHHICLKAGLEPGTWMDKTAELFRFTAEVFSE